LVLASAELFWSGHPGGAALPAHSSTLRLWPLWRCSPSCASPRRL